MFQLVKMNDKINQFLEDASKLSEEKLFNKYFADILKVKLERYRRMDLLKTELYEPVLSIGKKIKKKN